MSAAKKTAKDGGAASAAPKSPLVARIACGRSLQRQIEDVRTHGNHGVSPVLRAGVLAAMGVPRPAATAENAIQFGCYRPFTTPFLVRDALRLLELLGVSHTWLDQEYCCGYPHLSQADDGNRDEVRETARDFLRRNRELAAAKGASALYACCAACAYAARDLLPGGPVRPGYILDLLLDSLGDRPLSVPAVTLGYFEGCHTTYAPIFRDGGADWPRYRAFLDRVAGLSLVELTGCCKLNPEKALRQAEDRGISALVSPCGGCVSTLGPAGQGRVRAVSYPELLLAAFEGRAPLA